MVIFSLALMGTNFVDYLIEANRCLQLDGYIWIAEPADRFVNFERFKKLLHQVGFDIREIYDKGGFTFVVALKSERKVNEVESRKNVETTFKA